MSSTSRVRLTRLRESTYGALPTPAAMDRVRFTGGSFSHESQYNPTDEVRDDLMYTDAAREGYTASGTIEDEWVYGVHDAELQDAFGAAPSSAINLTGLTLTYANSDSSITRDSGSWVSDGLLAGGIYQFGGATATADNGRFRVVAVDSATKITVAATLVDEGPTGSCTVKQGGHFRLGTTLYSSVFEELFADISATELWQYKGGVCNSFAWQFSHPGKMTCSFGYDFKEATDTAATAGNGTVNAYPANRVMNSIDHFKVFQEGGALSTAFVKEASLQLDAPKRRIEAAGTLGAVAMGMNTFNLSGSFQFYNSVAARTIAAKHKAGTLTSFEWETQDASGNVWHFYVPRAVYTAGSPARGAKDQDVYVTVPWIGTLDTVSGTMVQLTRFPVA